MLTDEVVNLVRKREINLDMMIYSMFPPKEFLRGYLFSTVSYGAFNHIKDKMRETEESDIMARMP